MTDIGQENHDAEPAEIAANQVTDLLDGVPEMVTVYRCKYHPRRAATAVCEPCGADGDRSGARKMFRRALKAGLKQKNAAAAVAAYYGLVAAKARPVDNSLRLIIGRRFASLKKYGHALGIMAEPFRPGGEVEDMDRLLYEIGDILAGPLKDPLRASAAFSLLARLFPHSPRSLDAQYRLRRFHAVGRN